MAGVGQRPEDPDESDEWEKARIEQKAAEERIRKAREEAVRGRREET